MNGLLEARGVRVRCNGSEILRGVTLQVRRGERLAIVGPNGSGKTTLLRALAGVMHPNRGRILFEGRDLAAIPPRLLARRLALLPAETDTPFAFRVREFVAIGRLPHRRWFEREREEDDRVVDRSLEATGTASLADREVTSLSSGERQRVFLAQALAQEPTLLLLDEPTAHLDLAHEVEIFDRLLAENRFGLSFVAVLHDLNLAAEYAERILILNRGRIVAAGSPAAVLREEILEPVFGARLRVARDPSSGTPNVRIAPRSGAVASGARAD
ncbi:MAG TPA: ABC transporter ATP-binding protein [Planctomycetota bacterium]|nr:ABC transporter ATP-binding protein [Planctomycetota bacterium]